MPVLREKINDSSNDYSAIEESFKSKTGYQLTFLECEKKEIDTSALPEISIVIPMYNAERLDIVLKNLNLQDYNNFEVVIVDDASPLTWASKIEKLDLKYPVKYIRSIKNQGRPRTRNTGIAASSFEVIITLDQDMIIPSNFLLNMALRQAYTDNCVFVGFKENIDYEELLPDRKPDITKDWRSKQIGSSNFVNLAINKRNSRDNDRIFYLLSESDNFKKFSYGHSIGFWDLPSMVISHSLCFKRSAALEAGGFPEGIFKGWGMEDLAFGAALFCKNNFIIPAVDCVSFHINHKRLSGSREAEWKEFILNVEEYFNFLRLDVAELSFKEQMVEKIYSKNNFSFYESH